jgi:DNA-binding PadR family transcriptional regulator
MLISNEEKTTSNWMKEAQKGYIRVAALILINKKPAHGYEIMKEIKEKTSGFWTPTAGGVYPILRDLEKSGYIKGEWEVEKNRKLKTYKITESGKQILERAIVKQNEIANNMTALFKEFGRDVLNIETEAHPTVPSFFSVFLEEGAEKGANVEEMEQQRDHIKEGLKMMREKLKALENKIAEAKQPKTGRKTKSRLSSPK